MIVVLSVLEQSVLVHLILRPVANGFTVFKTVLIHCAFLLVIGRRVGDFHELRDTKAAGSLHLRHVRTSVIPLDKALG